MLHVVTLPQLVLFVTGNIQTIFFDCVPLTAVVFGTSIALSCAVYVTSRNDCPPNYHACFAAGSFVGCVCVIYTVAKEVVSVMKAVGIISDLTDSMIGLSILAWGNSIGDLFSNMALARQGYHQMAFSACFGGPLFSKRANLLNQISSFILCRLAARRWVDGYHESFKFIEQRSLCKFNSTLLACITSNDLYHHCRHVKAPWDRTAFSSSTSSSLSRCWRCSSPTFERGNPSEST